MKRSAINEILREAEAFLDHHGVILPPFAYWSPARLRSEGAAGIRQRGLGWDVTDYGRGRFDALGLFLFTLRNGTADELTAGHGALYAEKIMISRERQISPMHRHNMKTEDVVNRGGGDLVVELFTANAEGGIDREAGVTVQSDGVPMRLAPGAHLRLAPGQSVTLRPGDWHAFWAEGGDCLVGEVSTVNDDATDNVFEEPLPRYAHVEEDAEPLRLLVSDY